MAGLPHERARPRTEGRGYGLTGPLSPPPPPPLAAIGIAIAAATPAPIATQVQVPVSYTHLTLPTKRIV